MALWLFVLVLAPLGVAWVAWVGVVEESQEEERRRPKWEAYGRLMQKILDCGRYPDLLRASARLPIYSPSGIILNPFDVFAWWRQQCGIPEWRR